MSGENTLGLDALSDDLSINLDGEIIDGLPAVNSLESDLDSNKENKEIKPGEGKDGGIPPNPLESVAKVIDKDKALEDKESISSPGLSKIYSSLATHLSKEGVLSSLSADADIKDADNLAEAINNEITARLNLVQKEYKEAMESGTPKDEFVNHQKIAQQLNGITTEMIQEEGDKATMLRKNIMAQDFINRGLDRDEALKYAQRSIELGEDVNDSTTALGRLKEHNNTSYSAAVQKVKDEETKVHDDITKKVNNTDEIIKGIKIGTQTKTDLINQIITPVGQDSTGKNVNAFHKAYNEDPIRGQVIQNYLFMITKGYTDFSKINNAATSKVSREIDEVLKNSGGSFLETGGVNFNNKDNESSFTLGGEELQFDI